LSNPPEIKSLLLGHHARSDTYPTCPVKSYLGDHILFFSFDPTKGKLSLISHTIIVLSSDPVAIYLPSGEYLTVLTLLVCLFKADLKVTLIPSGVI
jgi:hypothetical protein